MAINPLMAFQKNKKLWMAFILMICMISFVFCTGTKGDLGEWLTKFGKRGTAIATISGRNVTREDLYELKTQRAIANELLHRCVEQAFSLISKELFEYRKKQPQEDKNAKKDDRRDQILQLTKMQMVLVERKSRANYFETGTKFEDLIEFKLWQAQADKMGIYLEDVDITDLFRKEYFYHLDPQQVLSAIYEVRRNHREATDPYIRRALGEEFRVMIAKYAVMGAQPHSLRTRRNAPNESFQWKFTDPEIPDEIRTPLTLGQLYDLYKTKCAEGEVTLIPVPVQDFVKDILTDPNEIQKKAFFAANKGKLYDPSTGDSGLDVPQLTKIEYVTANPYSPAYLNAAKAKQLLEVYSPLTWSPLLAWDPLQLPVVAAIPYLTEKTRILQPQYERITRNKLLEYRTSPYSESDITTPMLAWFAKRHPEAAASLVGAAALASTPVGFIALPQAEAGYLAFGATKEYEDAIASGQRAEFLRREPIYADVLRASLSPLQPFDVLGPICVLQPAPPEPPLQFQQMFNMKPSRPLLSEPLLPVEVVQQELRDMQARRQAEDWARERMQILRERLDPEKIQGDEQKFKRELDIYVPMLNLQHGPSPEAKATYYDRYTIGTSKDFEPLKKAFQDVRTNINFFEGRSSRPESILKEDDFYKMFFSTPGNDFAAAGLYQAKPWPPVVSPGKDFVWQQHNPRLIGKLNLDEEAQKNFLKQMKDNDPAREPPKHDMFIAADQPFLFWRTAQFDPPRPGDYDQIQKELDAASSELQKVQGDKKQEADLKEKIVCLSQLQKRITDGWKYQQARTTKALPKSDKVAREIIDSVNDPVAIRQAAAGLHQELIVLQRVTEMYPDGDDFVEYTSYQLPKGVIPEAREDMVKNIVALNGLKQPIVQQDEELDKINEKLFKEINDKPHQPERFVQILTNKPRSVYYIAIVTKVPQFDRTKFDDAMSRAGYGNLPGGYPIPPRDLFASRVQQEAGRAWRAAVVRDDLKRTLDYKLLVEDAAKDFDGSGG